MIRILDKGNPVWVRSSPAVSKTGICDTGSRAFDGIDLFVF